MLNHSNNSRQVRQVRKGIVIVIHENTLLITHSNNSNKKRPQKAQMYTDFYFIITSMFAGELKKCRAETS